jgi:hypothetical protein
MLKFTGAAKIGQVIRAFDFKPCQGRDDAFIEGVVEDADNTEMGYRAFKITVTADKFETFETKAAKGNRVGKIMFVPHQVDFMEFDARILNLSEI